MILRQTYDISCDSLRLKLATVKVLSRKIAVTQSYDIAATLAVTMEGDKDKFLANASIWRR